MGKKVSTIVIGVLLCILLVATLPFLISSGDRAKALLDYGLGAEKRSTTLSHVTENTSENLSSFLSYEVIEVTSDNIRVRFTDAISDSNLTTRLYETETVELHFEDYDIELSALESDGVEVDFTVNHPTEYDSINTELLLTGLGIFVLISFIVVLGIMIGGALKR